MLRGRSTCSDPLASRLLARWLALAMVLSGLSLACAVAGLAGVPMPRWLVWTTAVLGIVTMAVARLWMGIRRDRHTMLFHLARRAGVPALPFALVIVSLRSAVVVGLAVAVLRFLGR